MAQRSRYFRELEDFLPCGQAEALERSTNPYPTRGGGRAALPIATVPSKPVAGVPPSLKKTLFERVHGSGLAPDASLV